MAVLDLYDPLIIKFKKKLIKIKNKVYDDNKMKLPKVGERVYDKEYKKFGIVTKAKNIHNVFVVEENNKWGFSGFYCLDKNCKDYDNDLVYGNELKEYLH